MLLALCTFEFVLRFTIVLVVGNSFALMVLTMNLGFVLAKLISGELYADDAVEIILV